MSLNVLDTFVTTSWNLSDIRFITEPCRVKFNETYPEKKSFFKPSFIKGQIMAFVIRKFCFSLDFPNSRFFFTQSKQALIVPNIFSVLNTHNFILCDQRFRMMSVEFRCELSEQCSNSTAQYFEVQRCYSNGSTMYLHHTRCVISSAFNYDDAT